MRQRMQEHCFFYTQWHAKGPAALKNHMRTKHTREWLHSSEATSRSLTLIEGRTRPCGACGSTCDPKTTHRCQVLFQLCLMDIMHSKAGHVRRDASREPGGGDSLPFPTPGSAPGPSSDIRSYFGRAQNDLGRGQSRGLRTPVQVAEGTTARASNVRAKARAAASNGAAKGTILPVEQHAADGQSLPAARGRAEPGPHGEGLYCHGGAGSSWHPTSALLQVSGVEGGSEKGRGEYIPEAAPLCGDDSSLGSTAASFADRPGSTRNLSKMGVAKPGPSDTLLWPFLRWKKEALYQDEREALTTQQVGEALMVAFNSAQQGGILRFHSTRPLSSTHQTPVTFLETLIACLFTGPTALYVPTARAS